MVSLYYKLKYVGSHHFVYINLGAGYNLNAYFGRGTGVILLDNVGCTGRESRLLDCYIPSGVGVYSYNCGHDDDAGVRCNGMFICCMHTCTP